jgi:hypothetical protein
VAKVEAVVDGTIQVPKEATQRMASGRPLVVLVATN